MGLNPIGYKPWNGKRTEHNRRFLVIADSILRQKIKGIWFLGMLILGTFIVHVLPLILRSMSPHEGLSAIMMRDYLGDGLFFIFEVILVALVCSDLISEDVRSNSITLYLSRALRVEGYLLGKWLGAMITICLFTLIPPLAVSIAITVTQSGSDYLSSFTVVGQTFLAGLWSAAFFIPIGLAISSITRKKTYAGVGTFMFFFILMIVATIFTEFSTGWALLSPLELLYDTHTVIYGLELSADVNQAILGAIVFILTVPPLLLVYLRIMRKGVGK
ncbi:MAG: hypothetical protein E4H30_03675 [Methanomassiliicoccus sp.]|nr:MAG: hypothetical protein E4H30_03675 [Methanomassiliicoccus sp.]